MTVQKSSKIHAFHHSLRTICMAARQQCQDKQYIYISPPEKALTIENLVIHLKFTFDAGVAAPDRVLSSVGIGSDYPLFITSDPVYYRKIDINQAADGSRKIDVTLDLSHLLKKTNVNFRTLFGTFITNDFTYVVLKFADNNRGVSNVGTIDLCRIDAQFTTEGIR